MTRDDIIRMAQEADLWLTSNERIAAVERFAKLVAAAEREACAWLCQDLERHKWETLQHGGPLKGFSAMDCAAAIRARGQT